MQDREIMQDLLLLEKGACDLYLHGTVEASTKQVNAAFQNALTSSLAMQSAIYNRMAENGWYQTETAPQSEIDTVRQKYENQVNC